MKDILETIIRHLVENQDAIEITEASTDSNVGKSYRKTR